MAAGTVESSTSGMSPRDPFRYPVFAKSGFDPAVVPSGASGNARFASRSKWPWRASAACGTRSTRLRNKRNRSVGRCPCAWVRKRCYELTESPRSSETVPARSQGNLWRALPVEKSSHTGRIEVLVKRWWWRCAHADSCFSHTY